MIRLVRFVALAALAVCAVLLFFRLREQLVSPAADAGRLVLLFGGLVIMALIGGLLIAYSALPALADRIGNYFFSPNEKIEKSPHADAMACIAQGDFEGGIEEYLHVVGRNPHDTHALSEIVHLYADKLNDSASAAGVLENALAQDWPPDEAGFLGSRLGEIYWKYRHDAPRARHIYEQIAESLPGTNHAANAAHRLREIDQATLALGHDGAVAAHPEPAIPPADPEREPAQQPEKSLSETGDQDIPG